jgi:hypothetical protein
MLKELTMMKHRLASMVVGKIIGGMQNVYVYLGLFTALGNYSLMTVTIHAHVSIKLGHLSYSFICLGCTPHLRHPLVLYCS